MLRVLLARECDSPIGAYDANHALCKQSPVSLNSNMARSRVRKNKIVIVILISVFTVYNIIIYTQKHASPATVMSGEALSGQQLWQKNNCTACHQLYGLGGYLGPDLTNVISHPNKGPNYVKAFVNSGVKSMPEFNFSNDEKEQLVQFLIHVDKTGYYPNKDAVFGSDGWVTIKYKKKR